MRRSLLVAPVLALGFVWTGACHPPAPPPEPAPVPTPVPEPILAAAPVPHHFVGTLTLPNEPPRTIDWLIRYELGAEAQAKLWIPTQNVDAFAASSVTTAEDGSVTMEWAILKISWTITADGAQCEFVQGGVDVNCVLEEIDAEEFAEYTERQRPQTPLPPFPYVSVNLRVPNPDGKDVSLAATLTKPESPGPHPLVVLVSGSGAQDRDDTIFGHKPFLVLADALTRRGIAVVRFDDRGWAESTGDPNGTTADFATDALAVLRFVAARPDIDPKRVGIIGHSEGAMIAPMVAAAHPNEVSFIVMLAGPAVVGHELLSHQTKLNMQLTITDEKKIAADMAVLEQVYEIIATKPVDKAKPAIEALWKKAKPADEPGLDTLLMVAENAWMRFFLAYDPRVDLVKVKCPVLALNGSTDIQVDDEQNLPALTAAFKQGKNKQVTVLALPGLNHLFQHSETGNPADYEKIFETFDKDTLTMIGDWILERVEQP
jgi:pimeloyl-ACP methyl ester carboxylesterase